VQQNRFVNNRFGIWGRWGDSILLAANVFTNNPLGNYLTNVSNLLELPAGSAPQAPPPRVQIQGPHIAVAGEQVRFEAHPDGPMEPSLRFHWSLDGEAGTGPTLERAFSKPGFYRLGLTAENGHSARLDWRDLLVVESNAQELGTEGEAGRWGYELESNTAGAARIVFTDDSPGLVGSRCLRFAPSVYPGGYATAIYPGSRDAGWNLSGKSKIRFWIKTRNPNVSGWQNAGPVVRLLGQTGQLEFKPVQDANLLNEPAFSEARWLWMPLSIPLEGDARWQRNVVGVVSLERIDGISLSLDSWGEEPFAVWLDGLTIE
jgi:hypothetical protein